MKNSKSNPVTFVTPSELTLNGQEYKLFITAASKLDFDGLAPRGIAVPKENVNGLLEFIEKENGGAIDESEIPRKVVRYFGATSLRPKAKAAAFAGAWKFYVGANGWILEENAKFAVNALTGYFLEGSGAKPYYNYFPSNGESIPVKSGNVFVFAFGNEFPAKHYRELIAITRYINNNPKLMPLESGKKAPGRVQDENQWFYTIYDTANACQVVEASMFAEYCSDSEHQIFHMITAPAPCGSFYYPLNGLVMWYDAKSKESKKILEIGLSRYKELHSTGLKSVIEAKDNTGKAVELTLTPEGANKPFKFKPFATYEQVAELEAGEAAKERQVAAKKAEIAEKVRQILANIPNADKLEVLVTKCQEDWHWPVKPVAQYLFPWVEHNKVNISDIEIPENIDELSNLLKTIFKGRWFGFEIRERQ